ncbi:sterol desaturase family protein [Allocoleopsis franciscana]|uniref:Sterol desaturase n=1 Tax=Allocoleopsis franciscana PCC 7113 TaxID=1173027 RepID=K9WG33_9CYAN|nr:sterol desaturase family protein [Allocoleopsis franciscana]AFZ18729.1 sterol desaturase [Allocoleopsis franciscana PCC 7113]
MKGRLVRALVLYILLTVLFGILERFYPSIPNQPKWRRGVWLDSFYWFFTPMVIQILSMISIALVVLPLYLLLGRSLQWDSVLAGYGPISQLPLWVQGAIAIVIGDFIGYWTHRWHHTRQLWDYHAVHHSAEIVDWLTAVRLHPVNDIISRVMQASPLLILGISPIAVEVYVPFLSSYVALIHANISWTYGPFRYVLASPAFHRWHHTMDEEGWGKNFAGLFPIYDVIFGTFYMPRGRQPKNFGLYGETITENFMAQLLYPFRHWKFLSKWLNQSKPVTEYQEEETVNL